MGSVEMFFAAYVQHGFCMCAQIYEEIQTQMQRQGQPHSFRGVLHLQLRLQLLVLYQNLPPHQGAVRPDVHEVDASAKVAGGNAHLVVIRDT